MFRRKKPRGFRTDEYACEKFEKTKFNSQIGSPSSHNHKNVRNLCKSAPDEACLKDYKTPCGMGSCLGGRRAHHCNPYEEPFRRVAEDAFSKISQHGLCPLYVAADVGRDVFGHHASESWSITAVYPAVASGMGVFVRDCLSHHPACLAGCSSAG